MDISLILLELMIILMAAKVGAYLFERIGQPAVLGELLVGIILGNVAFFTNGYIEWFTFFRTDEFIHIFSEIGVIVLLFEIGLQSDISELLKVGWPSTRVAFVGVVLPFALGFWLTSALGISQDFNVALFLGATLTATSVGITARVLKDLGKLNLVESRVILGAAVIDDVLGLIILAVVSGIVSIGSADLASIATISVKAFGFLLLGTILGRWSAPVAMKILQKIEVRGIKLAAALATAFFASYLAKLVGLAPIVGAFAAGLCLDDIQFKGFNEKRTLEEMLSPISELFVPVFFVVVGTAVQLDQLLNYDVIWIGGILTFVAIVGKYVAGFAAYPRKVNFNAIGIGMIPRGEVGLIFASEGKRLGVITDTLFGVVVLLVMVTTLITPPFLSLSLKKSKK